MGVRDLGGEWLEEKELSRFHRFIKPNMSKILVTIVFCIMLVIVLPYPVKVSAIATDGYPIYDYDGPSTERPMYQVLLNKGHWFEELNFEKEPLVAFLIYDADLNLLYYYVPAMILIAYFFSCVLEEYYRQKSLKSF